MMNNRGLSPIINEVTILFITHQLPKGLQVDEAVVLGKETSIQQQQQQQQDTQSQMQAQQQSNNT